MLIFFLNSAYYKASSNELLGNPTKIFNVECPRQPQSHECGFYVLKYIRDLVRASNAIVTLKEKVSSFLITYFGIDNL